MDELEYGSIEQNIILFHHFDIASFEERQRFASELEVGFNYTIILSKTSRTHLEYPHGNCSYYNITSIKHFNGTNYIECYRKCIRNQYINRFNCTPLFIDNSVHDNELTDQDICNLNTFYRRNLFLNLNNYSDICNNICPKDCFKVDYSSTVVKSDTFFDNQNWFDYRSEIPFNTSGMNFDPSFDPFKDRPVERRIVWDSEPMFAYIDEPVMTFTQYMVNCGGLMGLWFGMSLEDVITRLIYLTKFKFWKSKLFKIIF